ncbi:hypothetical protein H4219_002364 [Mycoemilia scoparia]|uniref:Hyaluronan/mRNA-binding protein domain-containing protein n=1 Tax=Mycoemilia scoparia TaxID=417184 RepID=A0A9W8A482_9FUNG|nr:hypothetical protein H4219_002364 [Mycoemilia scoparia]
MVLAPPKTQAQKTKDRHLSRNGATKNLKKNGSGQYNWGNLDDEVDIEDVSATDHSPASTQAGSQKVQVVSNRTFEDLKSAQSVESKQ